MLLHKNQNRITQPINGFVMRFVVEATGFEPTTSASRTQRSTKLSHASKYGFSTEVVKHVVKRIFDRDFKLPKTP